MLALNRIGVVHHTIPSLFPAGEIIRRINGLKPKAIITASCGFKAGSKIYLKDKPTKFKSREKNLSTTMKVFKNNMHYNSI